ncbi:MAG: TetR/AcrR family transcriptional regulator [Myxococcota bacterium]
MNRTAGRESHQEQEARVIDASIACIDKSSPLDFTMAAVAKEAGLSLGSIYKHVQSKEDVLLAVATRVLRHQSRTFIDMLGLPLTTPERLVCDLLLSSEARNLYPFGFHLETLTSNDAILQRASPRWVSELQRIDDENQNLFVAALDKAVAEGELQVNAGEAQEVARKLFIGCWSLTVGFMQVAHRRAARSVDGQNEQLPFPLPVDHSAVQAMKAFLNTFPWKTPLDEVGIRRAATALKKLGHRA